MDEEKNTEIKVVDIIKNENSKIKFKLELKSRNTNIKYPDESYFRSKVSNMRKNTGFVKKMKNFSENNKSSIEKELKELNLTRYIEEIAGAIVECKMKISDINAMLEICTELHQLYQDFHKYLFEYLKKQFQSYRDDKVSSKVKIDMKFVLDLSIINIIPLSEGLKFIYSFLNHLINSDTDDYLHLNVLIKFLNICSFDLLGTFSRTITKDNDLTLPENPFIMKDHSEKFISLLSNYYLNVVSKCRQLHKSFSHTKDTNTNILMAKGEVSEEREKRLTNYKDKFETLLAMITEFADLCGFVVPEFKEIDIEEAVNDPTELESDMMMNEGEQVAIFDDLETQEFYTQLLDLKAILPGICYKDIEEQSEVKEEEENESDTEIDIDKMENELEEEEEEIIEEEIGTSAADDNLGGVNATAGTGSGAGVTQDEGKSHMSLEHFLASLLQCNNRQLVDRASQEFCERFNTKSSRLKLAKELANIPRSRLDLVPMYARLVANISQITTGVDRELTRLLMSELRGHLKRLSNIELKIKTIRFLGELVNFNVVNKSDAFSIVKLLLYSKTAWAANNRVDLLCAFLETCGRYLFRSRASHRRMKVYLEIMSRKAIQLDMFKSTMLNNTIMYCNPPQLPALHEPEILTNHEKFLRKLLHADLSKNNVDKIFKIIRKFPWNEAKFEQFGLRTFTEVWCIKYNNVPCLASILAGLAPYHQNLVVSVIDNTIEQIRVGLEENDAKDNQRRISVVRYLGNFYVYKLVSSSVIFNVLYSLISYGTSNSDLDPQDSFFRINLIHTLLDNCGVYFKSGTAGKKLDFFFMYVQKYFLYKRKLERELQMMLEENEKPESPVVSEQDEAEADKEVIENKNESVNTSGEKKEEREEKRSPYNVLIENQLYDLIKSLRPKCRIHKTYEECCDFVEKTERECWRRLEKKNIKLLDDSGAKMGTELASIDEEGDEAPDTPTNYMSDEENDQENVADQDDEEEEGHVEEEYKSERKSEDTMKPRYIACPEDDEFIKEVEKMQFEIVGSRALGKSSKITGVGALPKSWLDNKKEITKLSKLEPEEQPNYVKYALMTKKNGKNVFKELEVPRNEQFVNTMIENVFEQNIQNEKIAESTMALVEMQQEEDLRGLNMNFVEYEERNHERHKNYTGKNMMVNNNPIESYRNTGSRRK